MNKLLTNPLTGITNDINSIKTALDDTISTPHIGTIEATDFKTQNISSVDRSIGVLQLASDDAVYKSVPTTQVLSGDLNLPSSIGNVNVGAELGLVITQANGNTANISTLQTKTDNMSNPLSENKTDFNGFVRYNGFIYDDPPSINTLTPKIYVDTKLSKTEPNIQVLTGDIQIPMGETSALVGQNLYDLNSTSNELLNKTVNIDNSTFTDYTKINGNTQTGLLTIKRDDLAPTSANTFEIKNASDTEIYAIDGLGHNIGNNLILKTPFDGSYIRIRSLTSGTLRGITNNYGGVDRPVLLWNNTATANTSAVILYSNNAEIIRINTNGDASTRTVIIKATTTTLEGSVLIPGTINLLTPVGGVFSQINTKTNTSSTAEQTLISTGIGSLIVPANTFKQGDAYCLKLGGLKTNNNNDTIEIMLKSGATILGTTGSILLPALSNAPYDVEVNFTIRQLGILGTGLIHTTGFFSYTDAGAYRGANFTGLNTIATTISNTLNVVSVQSDVSNIITCESLILSKIY